MEDAVRRAVREAVGTAVAGLTVLAAEPARAVVRVTSAGQRTPLIVKVGRRSDVRGRGADFATTAAATAMAAGAGVPTPEVLAARTAGACDEWGWLVQRSADGSPWCALRARLGEDEVRAVHRRLAEAVLALQSVRTAGFGDLDAEGRTTDDDLPTALHARVDRLVADPADRAALHILLDREPDLLDGAPPTLCHDDLHAENVLLDQRDGQWRITAVLDWDKAWAGPAESDVARLAFWDGMTGPGFWEVYRAAVPEPPGWPRRALLHQLLWCLEYDAPTQRHRTDTAAVRAALLERG